MSDLREAYASTALASLEWSEERERAIDRVAAAGRASKLAADLWRCRYQNSSVAYHAVGKGLTELFLQRYKSETPEMARRVVDEALSEFLGPACSACSGARELIIEDLRIECDSCHGTGIKRYSDRERAHRMHMSLQRVKSLSFKLSWVSNELGNLDRNINNIVAIELERDDFYQEDVDYGCSAA